MKGQTYSVTEYSDVDEKDYDDYAKMDIVKGPHPAIIFSLMGKEVLKLEPGKFIVDGDTIVDTKAVYEKLNTWIEKVEGFGHRGMSPQEALRHIHGAIDVYK